MSGRDAVCKSEMHSIKLYQENKWKKGKIICHTVYPTWWTQRVYGGFKKTVSKSAMLNMDNEMRNK